jgi:L-fuconolactonase
MANRIIDTHIHIWDLQRAAYPWLQGDQSILNRTWAIDEIAEQRKEVNVVAGVLVQAGGNAEDTELMLEKAERTEWIKGVVGWLPLMNPSATQQLLQDKYLKEQYFKGVRHQVHDEKNTQWLLQPQVIESLQLLASLDIPYDVVGILPAHLETVIRLKERIPGLRLVLDHLNWPPIPSKERFGKWGELMKEVSKLTGIYAKISGLGTASGNFENRTKEDIKPYVAFTLEHFGTDRCFCGGDWPVSILANNYVKTWKITEQILDELLSKQELDKVLFSNAEKFYHLQLG